MPRLAPKWPPISPIVSMISSRTSWATCWSCSSSSPCRSAGPSDRIERERVVGCCLRCRSSSAVRGRLPSALQRDRHRWPCARVTAKRRSETSPLKRDGTGASPPRVRSREAAAEAAASDPYLRSGRLLDSERLEVVDDAVDPQTVDRAGPGVVAALADGDVRICAGAVGEAV